MKETKFCPACGHSLDLPKMYLDAVRNIRNEVEKFRPVIIKDFIENDLKDILFMLVRSHSMLSQAEYNRNSSYNNEHFSYKAEELLIEFFQKHDLFDDFVSSASESSPEKSKDQ